MMKRLDAMKVTNYEVSTVSYDTVKVTLKQDTSDNYTNIEKLMTFNGWIIIFCFHVGIASNEFFFFNRVI